MSRSLRPWLQQRLISVWEGSEQKLEEADDWMPGSRVQILRVR